MGEAVAKLPSYAAQELLFREVTSLEKRKTMEFCTNIWHLTSDICPRLVNQELCTLCICDINAGREDFITWNALQKFLWSCINNTENLGQLWPNLVFTCVEWIPPSGPGKFSEETKGENSTVAYLQHLTNLQGLSWASGLGKEGCPDQWLHEIVQMNFPFRVKSWES